jgi:NACHT domain
LRAYYNHKIDEQDAEEQEIRLGFISRQSERIVVDLEKELEMWLSKSKKDDAIRLISGGPGSGKSSFAKMFAAKLAEKGTIPVLFIPLHHFEPSEDLIDAVGKFVQVDGILPHNPLDTEYRESRLLIIFDGLDELAMQGKIAEKTAQGFVREVQRKVERLNQRETCVQVLISGRELVVQTSETEFRKEGQILHVLPYFVPEYELQGYVDKKKLLKQDQRQLWWQNYGAVSGNGYIGLPPELDQGNLTDITAQPLLNYLVALSLRRGKLEFSKGTNLNAVYADLLKAIYERGWAEHQHSSIQGINGEDFVRILEEIALAAWHGSGRTTTVRDIERHCDNSNLKNLLKRFQDGFRDDSKASITRLLTAFYFRQSGHDQSGQTYRTRSAVYSQKTRRSPQKFL